MHLLNDYYNKIIAAYTFDAGPNAVIYTLDIYKPIVVVVMAKYFPPIGGSSENYCNKPAELDQLITTTSSIVPEGLFAALDKVVVVDVVGGGGDDFVSYFV